MQARPKPYRVCHVTPNGMRDYAIVGAKRSGKTTLAKSLVRRIGAPVLVFDKNNEWGQTLPTMADFLQTAKGARYTCIVFEDAGIFFGPTGRSAELLDILTAARHTRNTCILLFHSLRQVPLYVIEQLDGMFILPTRDLPKKVESRFEDWPDVVDAHANVMARKEAGEPYPSEFILL